jgi:hypothetical protein
MDPAVILETGNATAARLTGWTVWEFTWGKKGSCTMLEGATWTLFPNGTATFDATVTSSSRDDAVWTIWHVDVLDHNGVVLGSLASAHPVEGDWRKFVQRMPDSAEHYRFRALATFDAAFWDDIAGLKMFSSC